MRLNLKHLFAVEEAQPGQAVLGSAVVEVPQPGHFGFVRGDDQLAADFVGHGVFPAKADPWRECRTPPAAL